MTMWTPPLFMLPTPAWWLAQATQCHGPHRELPKRKYAEEELKPSKKKSPDKQAPVSKQKKQLLIDCLNTIIR